MLRKRLIFTLLFSDGYFVLSRNFRLQKVGNLDWLKKNYNFSKIAFSIDELIVLDVSRGPKNASLFCEALKSISDGCFVPIAAGGGVRSVLDAHNLLRSGADKVVVNTPLYGDQILIHELAKKFGQQCIIGSVDLKSIEGTGFRLYSNSGTESIEESTSSVLNDILDSSIGELYLNSIDRDGTGQGYDLKMLDLLPLAIKKPVIIAGGVGNAKHLIEGLSDSRVDAAATAHLFNFVGDGLKHARQAVINSGLDLPIWNESLLINGT
jgi:cyclase